MECSGQTALYDSVFLGISTLLLLQKRLMQYGSNNLWNFVHIIITDGEDSSSETTLADLQEMMQKLERLPQAMLKTYFIGVDINQQAQNQLQTLASYAGANGEFMNIKSNQMQEIFGKIIITIQQQKKLALLKYEGKDFEGYYAMGSEKTLIKAQLMRYVILFNLDISQSMIGAKWSQVIEGVTKLVTELDYADQIACILFNEKPKLLSLLKLKMEMGLNYNPLLKFNVLSFFGYFLYILL